MGEIYSSLSIECQKDFMSHSKTGTFKRGEIVVREGQFSKKAYLIVQGCVRAYYLKDVKDISDWFTFENKSMVPIVSFFNKEPSSHVSFFLVISD